MYICLNRATAGGQLSLPDFVKLSAAAGFHGCDTDPNYGVHHGTNALRDLYASHNQRHGGWGPGDWRNDDESKWRDCLDALKKSAPVAADLQIDSCATWIMPSSKLSLMENWRFHVTRLKPVADILHQHGLRLGLEFVSPQHLRRQFPHEFIFTPGQMLELAADIGPNAGLLVDSFHCHAADVPVTDISRIPSGKIVLVHLNDAPRVPVPDLQDGQRLLPGHGAIDPRAFLSALKQSGYAGPVSVEVFSADLRALPPEQAAAQAWQSCKGLLS